MDSDLPLSYVSGFVSPSSSTQLIVRECSLVSFTSSMSPAGSQPTWSLTCFVQVLDVVGASATMYQDVVVTAAQHNASHLTKVVDDLLAASAGSAHTTSRVIATVGATLNSVYRM